ncbi:MAG: bi-domain-containing oxidoreductase [Actinomycetota bacterium]|nr:bi-domain-containing oxidoreductase [Actinomycetota bacterium]
MKQVAQNYKSGELTVLDVPVPACKPGGVLVRSRYSLISTGTELMKVSEAQLSLLGKARARPDQLRKALDTVNQLGPVAAYQKVVSRLDSYTPLGYSLCGIVTEVGRGAHEFSVGQLVACAGNEHALHAEVNWVPVNLCVPVADGVDPKVAAFTTVGAIALHGVRRAEVQLGEAACVIGLGLVGQLVVRLLVAAGVKVVGLDPDQTRCALAEAAGALVCDGPSDEGTERVEQALAAASGGLGADHVFIAAGGASNDPIVAAARLARDRARVVDIGKCTLDLPWNEYYEKELDVRFSRSYGPGRYDPRYELEGVDYPAGYVRWTERRNLACFADLLRGNRLGLDALVSGVYPVTDAVDVYRQLKSGELRGVGFLFEYPEEVIAGNGVVARPPPVSLHSASRRPAGERALRIGFLGAGNYASSMLLPHLARRDDVELATVVTTTSLSATNAQRKFGFERTSTDASRILGDESIDAVFVVTRHHSHADLAARALEAGKAVFVEKPLALSLEELDRVLAAVGASRNDRLMVGFNRRFAPLLVGMRSRFGAAGDPAVVRYLVNAGRLDARSWYSRSESEGSRFEGEGGHFIDTMSWWLGATPLMVHAVSTWDPDDLLATLRFDDGSIGSLGYVTGGNRRYPKETIEVSTGGRSARLDNFRKATVWSGRRAHVERAVISTDKGQHRQLEAFLDAVRSGGPMPISLDSLAATARATLAVTQSLTSGRPEAV